MTRKAVQSSRGIEALRAVLSLAVALAACGGKPCPEYPHTEAEPALAAHRAQTGGVRALRGKARVDQRGRDGRIRGEVLMFVERPDRVRFDAMTQFGPASVLTSDGAAFALTDLRENRFLVGPTCPRNIERLLGIPLSGEEVARFLVGDTPEITALDRSIECNGDGVYRIRLRAEDGTRQEIDFDMPDPDRRSQPAEQHLWLLRSEVFTADGDTVWRVTFGDYRQVEDRTVVEAEIARASRPWLPFEIRFEHPGAEADVLLKFDDIAVNVPVPEGAFSQAARPGITVETVGCE